MAEALFRSLLCEKLDCENHELGNRGYRILSAGVHAMHGLSASPETIEVLTDQGIELLDHSSQPVSRELLEVADAVYAMTNSHRDSILIDWPEFSTKVELLSRDRQDIHDPIGMGIEEYRRCKAQIEESLQHILESI